MQCSGKLISRGSKSQHNQPNQEQSVEESRKHEAKGPMKRSMAETITRETKGEGQKMHSPQEPKKKEQKKKKGES